jgi:hypothetical protein
MCIDMDVVAPGACATGMWKYRNTKDNHSIDEHLVNIKPALTRAEAGGKVSNPHLHEDAPACRRPEFRATYRS